VLLAQPESDARALDLARVICSPAAKSPSSRSTSASSPTMKTVGTA
jgi:hypothetical protein